MSFDDLRCPLCAGSVIEHLADVRQRRYVECRDCLLAFMTPEYRPTVQAEAEIYGLHENCPDDPHYRAFLDRLAQPLQDKLKPGARGLDFGCGPGPTLSVMLRERGYSMRDYDPIFANHPSLLEQHYDFICCTEVAEHFFAPAREFALLDRMLEPGAWLGVMTQWRLPDANFASWQYHRDPTHVCFYQRDTLQWIADRWQWQLETPATHIALFNKPLTR